MGFDFSMTFYTGRPGQGKTTALTFQALQNYLFMWDCLKCKSRMRAGISKDGNIQCTNCFNDDEEKMVKVVVYSNYHLEFPHIRIHDIEGFNKMRHGFGAFDELWKWADARESLKTYKTKGGKKESRNRIVSAILGACRKRKVEIGYTAQTKRQIDVRIRENTDTICRTWIDQDTLICYIYMFEYFGHEHPFTIANNYDNVSFNLEPIFQLFDTDEEINDLILDEAEDDDVEIVERKME